MQSSNQSNSMSLPNAFQLITNFWIPSVRDLQNRTGHLKTEPNRHRRWPKNSQTEGFGSVSVLASGVTGRFLGLTIFPRRDRISSPREVERDRRWRPERGREREGEGVGESQNLMAEGNAAG